MSSRLNPAQVLNQKLSEIKKEVSFFCPSTSPEKILEAKQELEQLKGELQSILQKNSQFVMALALAQKEIPKLINRCETLIPSTASIATSSKQAKTLDTVPVQQSLTANKVHQRVASIRRKDHPLKGRSEVMKDFEERFKSGTLRNGSISKERLTTSLMEEKKLNPVAATEIKVRCKVPFGHTLNIRGEGASLSWEKGIPLKKIDEETYVYRLEGAFENVQYKILLDDSQWENSDNRSVQAEKSQEISPNIVLPNVPVGVNYDGSGKLFIRGTGPGMSWEKGLEMKNPEAGKWTFETSEVFKQFSFKVVLNDQQWEQGEDHLAENAKTLEISPRF